MSSNIGTEHFSADLLAVFKAFKGDLTAGDLALGRQWFRVWEQAQEAMREAVQARAAQERRLGRVEVADALESAVAPSPGAIAPATPDVPDPRFA